MDGRKPLVVKHLGLMPYAETAAAMRTFTLARDGATPDEIWLTGARSFSKSNGSVLLSVTVLASVDAAHSSV